MAVGPTGYPRSVYSLKHNVTGKIYIGTSHQPDTRREAHLSALRRGRHPVEDLQKDFDEKGNDFTFEVIDEISGPSEDNKEFEWMFKLKTYDRDVGYNYRDRVCLGYVKQRESGEIPAQKKRVAAKPDGQTRIPSEPQRHRDARAEAVEFIKGLSEEQAAKLLDHMPEILRRVELISELKEIAITLSLTRLEGLVAFLRDPKKGDS